MKFYTLKSNSVRKYQKTLKRPYKYRIDWYKPSRSKFQSIIKDFLQEFWVDDVVFEEFPVVGTRMTLDIYNDTRKIAVEVQGRQHDEFVPYFHKNKLAFKDQLQRDAKKREFCEINGIFLLEVRECDKLNEDFFKSKGIDLR